MEALKFTKIRRFFHAIIIIFILSIVTFFSSKHVAFYIYKNSYFTDGRIYNSEDIYLNSIPKTRTPSNIIYDTFEELKLKRLYLRIPKKNINDSLVVKSNDSLSSLTVSYFLNGKLRKNLLLIFDKLEVSSSIKADLSILQINNANSFRDYEVILGQKPIKDILFKTINDIDKSLKLSSLKQVIYSKGSEKSMFKFENQNFKYFQFCSPNFCNYTSVKIFIEKKEITLISKGFNQKELDFILLSLEIINDNVVN